MSVSNLVVLGSLILLVFITGGVIVYRATRSASGRWGLNINPKTKWRDHGILAEVKCPVCSTELDKFRKPQNLHELLWGGWTCPNCKTPLDKWGHRRQ